MAADITEPRAQPLVSVKLRHLLQRARTVKPETTVEPPLPAAELKGEIDALGEGVFQDETESQRHTIVEAASRRIFYQIIDSTDIHDPNFVQLWDLLDILSICAEQNQCEAVLPFYLIEELLESQTSDCCRIVFNYLESRAERLMRTRFHTTHLVVLRACNELLRRLSRAEDAVFCGRVFFFLFRSFPLGDKSSVNLRGEFHTDNVTNFDKDVDAAEDQAMLDVSPAQSAAPSTDDNKKLYQAFWQLQEDFTQPTRLFEADRLATFKAGLRQTIDKFESTPVVIQTKSGDPESETHDEKRARYDGNYNPKYLTSRDLFELELSDLSFQRHILVQALIIIDFLLSTTDKAKRKIADANISKVNISLIYQYTLSDDDRDWAFTTRSKIAQYLQKGQDGNFYYRMVNTVLSRDKNWVRWKIENCPSIIKDPIPVEEHMQALQSLDRTTASVRMRAKPMGAIDLSFLSEKTGDDGMEQLRERARTSKPSMAALMKGITTDKLDLEMATEDEADALKNAIANKEWRALRLGMRTSLAKLDQVDPGKDITEVFAEPVQEDMATEE